MTDIDEQIALKRLRRSYWADPETYLLVQGAWAHLYSRGTQQAIGEPTPQSIVAAFAGLNDGEWEEYTGPLDPEDKALTQLNESVKDEQT